MFNTPSILGFETLGLNLNVFIRLWLISYFIFIAYMVESPIMQIWLFIAIPCLFGAVLFALFFMNLNAFKETEVVITQQDDV